MSELAGKHVLITGASRGVGASVAALLGAAGARLSLFSRTFDADIRWTQKDAPELTYFQGDLAQKSDVDRAVEQFENTFGPVDILVNNAGFGRYEPFATSSFDDIAQTIATNFTGLVTLTHRVIPAMITRKSGLIINVASDLGRRPLANMAVYAATKHAVVGFSQSLARELRPHGVRSSVLLPGLIDSHFGGRTPGEVPPDIALTCDEVAQAILYVATSPESVLIDELAVRSCGQEV